MVWSFLLISNLFVSCNSLVPVENTCITAKCIQEAIEISEEMNRDVNPCNNFYEFVCGRYFNESGAKMKSYKIVENDFSQQLRMTFENDTSTEEEKLFDYPKKLYAMCMNETSLKAQGVDPLLKTLKTLGGWPILRSDHWNNTNLKWIEIAAKFLKNGYDFNSFFQLGLEKDWNSSKNMFFLNQPKFEYITRDLLISIDKNIMCYEYYGVVIFDVAVEFGAKTDRAQREAIELCEFEINLANITPPIEESINVTLMYNPMTINEMSKKWTGIPWLKYFTLFTSISPDLKISENDTVIVMNLDFVTKLEKLISQTSPRVLMNYALWRFILSSKNYFIHPITEILRTVDASDNRWETCISQVSGLLPDIVDAIYIRMNPHIAVKTKKVIMMNNEINNQFMEIIQQVPWMDEDTRVKAVEKLKNMKFIVSPSPNIEEMKKIYQQFEVDDNDTYFGNILKLHALINKQTISRFRNKPNFMDIVPPSTIPSAYYLWTYNLIYIPTAELHDIFFDMKLPNYINYGRLGFIIGHEITHGFDDIGRMFDKYGNLNNWWTEASNGKFLKLVTGIIHRYNNFTSHNELKGNVSGKLTSNENIADNAGFKLGYRAYRVWAKTNGPEASLPKLPYTANQMYWISATTIFCSTKEHDQRSSVREDVHSPNYARVLGSLSSIPEFSEDFNCAVGSNMNPEKKLTVW